MSNLPRNLVFHYPGACFLVYILRKMLETCASTTLPDFQRQMEWCQIYFTKMSLNPIYRKHQYYTTQGYCCVANFGLLATLIFQCDNKCKTCLAKYDLGNLICEDSFYTMTWCEEKQKMPMTFTTHK